RARRGSGRLALSARRAPGGGGSPRPRLRRAPAGRGGGRLSGGAEAPFVRGARGDPRRGPRAAPVALALLRQAPRCLGAPSAPRRRRSRREGGWSPPRWPPPGRPTCPWKAAEVRRDPAPEAGLAPRAGGGSSDAPLRG